MLSPFQNTRPIFSLVTLAIASYNNGKYIERCLKSVINQSYKDLEILIIDDGSNDGSLSLIEKFKSDNRVRVISKENGGLSSVRQMALDEATGKYISFIDADDVLDLKYVEQMVNALERTGADICVCSTEMLYEDDTVIEEIAFKYKDCETPLKLTNSLLSNVSSHLDVYYTLTDSWNKMYRMDFLRQTGVEFNIPKGLNGTDMLFNYKLALYEPSYVTLSDLLYKHYIYKKSVAHRKKKDLFSSYEIIISQLFAISNMRGREEITNNMIANLYLVCLREAYDDLYTEEKGAARRNSLNALHNRHIQFIDKNPVLKQKRKEYSSRSLKFFDYALVSRLTTYLYISLRAKLKNK